ncbi:cytochrome b [Variovorax sp. J22R133]|uniref:cytochrome b n=1 Tax=Variovorax brevis TaxID=3053503 RepID=UPI002576AD1D|nr:cytochrome b [Variovorax sp. J22R133]MDM0113116.1 cytochrome b [Variovorax sp. J22R133]
MPRTDVFTKYTRTAIVLHWLLAIGLLSQITFGFFLDEIAPRNTPARAGVINLHKSCGMVLGMLIMLRLVWRFRHAPPPWPATMLMGERRAATIGHWLLYGCMVVMPLSGYVASNFSKFGVVFFGVHLEPWAPTLPKVYAIFNGVHVVTAFIFTALIVGHIVVALRHAWVQRDGIFSRMLW